MAEKDAVRGPGFLHVGCFGAGGRSRSRFAPRTCLGDHRSDGQCSTYQFHDTSANASLHQRWDVSDSARLRSDGGNLAAVLLDLRENDSPRYRQLVRQIQRVFPTLDDFVLEPVAGKVLLRWKSKYSDKVFGAHLTSTSVTMQASSEWQRMLRPSTASEMTSVEHCSTR